MKCATRRSHLRLGTAGALTILLSACTVKVEAVAPTATVPAVAALTVSPSAVLLSLDLSGASSQALSATVVDANGSPLTGRSISWTSSAPSVATVSPLGGVTAVAVGKTTITATSEGKSGTAAVNVVLDLIAATTFAPGLAVNLAASTRTATGLYYRDISTGAGASVTTGKQVTVRYTGWLANGTQFDSGTIPFVYGVGQVIQGWDQGLGGMQVGAKRQLIIPPSLGYGASGSGPIPGNAITVFNVEIISVP